MKLGKIGINFSIFKWRSIAIAAIVALLIISTQFWFGSMNGNRSNNDKIVKYSKNTYHLKTVGSCNQPTTVEIYDETGGVDPAASKNFKGQVFAYSSKPVNVLENKHFKKYITTISKYLFAKVDAIGLCQSTSGSSLVEMAFVYRPTISSGIVPFNDFKHKKSQDSRQLNSPWVKLALNKSPNPSVKALFTWNERQFLLDQALLFGGRMSDTKPLMPIALKTFDDWERNYASVRSPQLEYLAQKLPTDIQWLFKYARISDCREFLNGEAMCGLKMII